MPANKLNISNAEITEAISTHGSIRAAARALNLGESTIRMRLKRAVTEILVEDGASHQIEFKWGSTLPPKPIVFEPYPDRTRHFILTAAQDDSAVHEDFWKCLNVYSDWLEDCEILVAGFAYSKRLFSDHETRSANIGFHSLINEFVVHDQVKIGDGLAFCAEANTQPTAVRPLSGFTTYTRKRWGIFPHVKVALESVPTMKNDRSKQIMTTGAVTLPNYIRMKAGVKAMHHHVCGAVLVELAPDGEFWCRHILATDFEDGSFYDMDCFITRDGVSTDHSVEALTYGDIHHEKLDPKMAMATWGYDVTTGRLDPIGLVNAMTINPATPLVHFLQPHFEFYHDLSDFTPRNHHSIKDHHFRFSMHNRGTDSVEEALRGCAEFLHEVLRRRPNVIPVVVESNHDQALIKWLKTADYRDDPENARFFLKLQGSYYTYLSDNVSHPPVFSDFLKEAGCPDDVEFLDEDESFTICGGIECGMHGHLGTNGSRASPMQFAKAGSRSNTGHTHSPQIIDGAYVAGVSGKLDMGYNKGLSSWAHAHIVTYSNGKRAILTMSKSGRFYG